MRRRATFIGDSRSDFDPASIKIQNNRLSFDGLKAAREERLTIGFRELPGELHHVLQNSQELHIRWVSENSYRRSTPYLSALTPGLHVSFTPLIEPRDEILCPLLKNLFDTNLKCKSVESTFIQPVLHLDHLSPAATWQYYSLLPTLNQFVSYLQRNVCPADNKDCAHTAALIKAADYLDIDYDGEAHILEVTILWSKPPPVRFDPVSESVTYNRWNVVVDASANDKVEVGILEGSETPDPHDLQLGGFLAALGDDVEPKPTMFFFPSRHHVLQPDQAAQQTYTVSFDSPTGLHPTMRISFPSALHLKEPARKPTGSSCVLNAYLTLPSVLFADEYAFASDDALFQDAHKIRQIRSFSGEKDLEAPDYVVEKWGSSMLIELQTPGLDNGSAGHESWDITLPLHLRYLEPAGHGHRAVQIPWPVVFWSCTAEEGVDLRANPFDRTNLGYDNLFDAGTMFYHLNTKSGQNNGSRLVETLQVPVLDSSTTGHRTVETGTSLIILFGFLWVLVKLVPGLRRSINAISKPIDEDKHVKKT